MNIYLHKLLRLGHGIAMPTFPESAGADIVVVELHHLWNLMLKSWGMIARC